MGLRDIVDYYEIQLRDESGATLRQWKEWAGWVNIPAKGTMTVSLSDLEKDKVYSLEITPVNGHGKAGEAVGFYFTV